MLFQGRFRNHVYGTGEDNYIVVRVINQFIYFRLLGSFLYFVIYFVGAMVRKFRALCAVVPVLLVVWDHYVLSRSSLVYLCYVICLFLPDTNASYRLIRSCFLGNKGWGCVELAQYFQLSS